MRRLLLLAVLLLASLPGDARAESWRGEAVLAFAGTSTLHDWEGAVPAKPFAAEVASVDGRPDRVAAALEAAVAEMDTDNDGRDENLRKAMRAGEHPKVLGKVDARIPPEVLQGSSGRVPIELNLLGRARRIEGMMTNWKMEGNRATFDYEFTVSLEACGIEIPSFLLFIRVGDEVRVRASVSLTRP